MDSASSGIRDFFAQLASAQVLTEIISIVVAAALAVAGGRYARLWLQRSGRIRQRAPGWARASRPSVLAAPMFIGILALFLLHLLLIPLRRARRPAVRGAAADPGPGAGAAGHLRHAPDAGPGDLV